MTYSNPQPNSYRLLQRGDDIRVTLKDNSTLDCTIRQIVPNGTLIVTTPLGNDDPDGGLQSTYYIDDYVQLVYPIPGP